MDRVHTGPTCKAKRLYIWLYFTLNASKRMKLSVSSSKIPIGYCTAGAAIDWWMNSLEGPNERGWVLRKLETYDILHMPRTSEEGKSPITIRRASMEHWRCSNPPERIMRGAYTIVMLDARFKSRVPSEVIRESPLTRSRTVRFKFLVGQDD